MAFTIVSNPNAPSSKMKKATKQYSKRRRKQSKNTKQTKELIRKTVHNEMAEEKAAAPLIARNNRIFNEFNDVIQAVSLMPTIGQGVGQGARIGNNIYTRRVMLYLQISIDQILTGSTNIDPPKFVDVFIFKYKKSNKMDSSAWAQFLQYGDTTTTYSSGSIPECGGFDVNKDSFTIKKRMRYQLWNPDPNNTNCQATRCQNAIAKKIDITKFYKKNLMYNDDVTNVVSNDNLFISVAYTNNDQQNFGASLSVGNFDTTVLYEYDDI